jgi:hypothetical protein
MNVYVIVLQIDSERIKPKMQKKTMQISVMESYKRVILSISALEK